jgi:hypothetical protein
MFRNMQQYKDYWAGVIVREVNEISQPRSAPSVMRAPAQKVRKA